MVSEAGSALVSTPRPGWRRSLARPTLRPGSNARSGSRLATNSTAAISP